MYNANIEKIKLRVMKSFVRVSICPIRYILSASPVKTKYVKFY